MSGNKSGSGNNTSSSRVPLSLSHSSSGSLSLSCPSHDASPSAPGPPAAFPSTPSKHKYSKRNSNNNSYFSNRTINSFWKTLRWVLLGFGIGAASTALFQAVNIPTIRVELEYADAPALLETSTSVLHRAAKAAHLPPLQQDWLTADKQQESEEDEKDKLDDTDDNVDNDEGETRAEKEEDEEQVGLADDDEEEGGNKKNKKAGLRSQNVGLSQKSKQGTTSKFVFPSTNTSTTTTTANSKSQTSQNQKPQTQTLPLPGDPVFLNVPPPPTLEPDESFAACLLIKDDNHWLIEWLAYHYHAMPLRDLIVAVDPDSKTTPMNILNRWSKDTGLMNVTVWNDTEFMPKEVKGNLKLYDNNTELMVHRTRQNTFFYKCINQFKNKLQKEWLMLVDTDEYIVTNYASGLYFNLTKDIPVTKPGNVLTFIKQHHQLTGINHTCLYEPRFMFGAKEQKVETTLNKHIPQGANFNGYDLLTQRFVYRNPRRMHNGKNLLNLKLLPKIKALSTVHHISSACPGPDQMRTVNHVRNSLVKVHHYLGTQEQYFFRSDPRQQNKNATKSPQEKKKNNPAYFTRGKGRYNTLNARANYADHGARAWIKGFIEDVGLERANLLLEGVGQVGFE